MTSRIPLRLIRMYIVAACSSLPQLRFIPLQFRFTRLQMEYDLLQYDFTFLLNEFTFILHELASQSSGLYLLQYEFNP